MSIHPHKLFNWLFPTAQCISTVNVPRSPQATRNVPDPQFWANHTLSTAITVPSSARLHTYPLPPLTAHRKQDGTPPVSSMSLSLLYASHCRRERVKLTSTLGTSPKTDHEHKFGPIVSNTAVQHPRPHPNLSLLRRHQYPNLLQIRPHLPAKCHHRLKHLVVVVLDHARHRLFLRPAL